MFVTIFYGVLNTYSGVFEYANGGHNPPYLLRQGGAVEPLESTGGTVLGAIEGVTYRARSITLEGDDRLLLYTDGVTEAMDDTGNLYSEQRLQQLLRGLDAPEAESLVHAVVEEVKRYAGAAPQHDDVTVLAIRKNGRGAHR
jgi:sigma-B regulation protein RsbU (phosphoserine phosphatase)